MVCSPSVDSIVAARVETRRCDEEYLNDGGQEFPGFNLELSEVFH